jgi:hypothetical protein
LRIRGASNTDTAADTVTDMSCGGVPEPIPASHYLMTGDAEISDQRDRSTAARKPEFNEVVNDANWTTNSSIWILLSKQK